MAKAIKDNKLNKEADILFAEDRVVNIGTRELVIKPFSWVKSAQAIVAISKMIELLIAGGDKSVLDKIIDSKAKDTKEILELVFPIIANHGESLFAYINKLIILGSDISKDELNNISFEVGIDLVVEIFEVNKDFFMKRFGITENKNNNQEENPTE